MNQDVPFPQINSGCKFPKEVPNTINGLCSESHVNIEFSYHLTNITIPDTLLKQFTKCNINETRTKPKELRFMFLKLKVDFFHT